MNRERITGQDPQPPSWVGLALAVAICVPFWAVFAWLVAGLD